MSNLGSEVARVPGQFHLEEQSKLEPLMKWRAALGLVREAGSTALAPASGHIPLTLYPEEYGINEM
jgi:hypothetical protein